MHDPGELGPFTRASGGWQRTDEVSTLALQPCEDRPSHPSPDVTLRRTKDN